MGTAAVLAGRGVVREVCIVRTGRDGRYLVPWSSTSSLPPIIPGMKGLPDVHGVTLRVSWLSCPDRCGHYARGSVRRVSVVGRSDWRSEVDGGNLCRGK